MRCCCSNPSAIQVIINRSWAFSIRYTENTMWKHAGYKLCNNNILYEILSLFFILFYRDYSWMLRERFRYNIIFIFVGAIDEWTPVRILCTLNDAHTIIGTKYHEFNIFNRNVFIEWFLDTCFRIRLRFTSDRHYTTWSCNPLYSIHAYLIDIGRIFYILNLSVRLLQNERDKYLQLIMLFCYTRSMHYVVNYFTTVVTNTLNIFIDEIIFMTDDV